MPGLLEKVCVARDEGIILYAIIIWLGLIIGSCWSLWIYIHARYAVSPRSSESCSSRIFLTMIAQLLQTANGFRPSSMTSFIQPNPSTITLICSRNPDTMGQNKTTQGIS